MSDDVVASATAQLAANVSASTTPTTAATAENPIEVGSQEGITAEVHAESPATTENPTTAESPSTNVSPVQQAPAEEATGKSPELTASQQAEEDQKKKALLEKRQKMLLELANDGGEENPSFE